MALSLGVQKGSRIKVGLHVLEVENIIYGQQVQVTYEGKEHLVSELQRVELTPGVYVTYGRGQRDFDNSAAPQARLAFEAPKSVEILRL